MKIQKDKISDWLWEVRWSDSLIGPIPRWLHYSMVFVNISLALATVALIYSFAIEYI